MLHEPALTHYTQEDNKDTYVNKQLMQQQL